MRKIFDSLSDTKIWILNLFVVKVNDPEDLIFNRVISDISVAQRELTLSISDSIETCSQV